jgi:hypothetical protein
LSASQRAFKKGRCRSSGTALEKIRLVPKEVVLVKDSMLRCDHSPSHRVVEQPALIFCRITHKNALLEMASRSVPFVFLHMHIGKAAPDTKMRSWSPALNCDSSTRYTVYLSRVGQKRGYQEEQPRNTCV